MQATAAAASLGEVRAAPAPDTILPARWDLQLTITVYRMNSRMYPFTSAGFS